MAKLKNKFNYFLAFIATFFTSTAIDAQEDPKETGSDDSASSESENVLSAVP